MKRLFVVNMVRWCPLVDAVHTCKFHRKSRRAVDSTCWECRSSARTKTVRITGVMTLRDTLVTTNGLQSDGYMIGLKESLEIVEIKTCKNNTECNLTTGL